MKALFVVALLLLSIPAKADSVWDYHGNALGDPTVGHLDFEHQTFVPTPNPCQCAIEGSLVLSDSGVPTLWNFTVGAITLTNLNSTLSLDDLAWPGNPNLFAGWFLAIQGAGARIASSFYGSNYEATDGVSVNGAAYQYVQGNHGFWTDPIATPEPSTIFLLLVATVALCLLRFLQEA